MSENRPKKIIALQLFCPKAKGTDKYAKWTDRLKAIGDKLRNIVENFEKFTSTIWEGGALPQPKAGLKSGGKAPPYGRNGAP